jgi:hypothetical protein
LFAAPLHRAQTFESVPTYTGEVATILEKHCNGCHRTGGVGRIPLDSYEQARAFAPEIRNSIGTRKMPPWLAVAGFGEFQNDPSLSIREMETLIRWADSYAPRGLPIAQPAATVRPLKWALGTPDLVLQPKTSFRISVAGEVECKCFVIHTQSNQSRAVRAIDVIPSDPRLVDYVRVFANRNPSMDRSNTLDSQRVSNCPGGKESLTRTSLGEWSAGTAPQSLPQGIGRLLPAKAEVVVEIHYRSIGYKAADRSRIGLYFHEQPVTQFVQTKTVIKAPLRIKAREWNFRAETEWHIFRDAMLLSISPYMRRLGTEMKAIAVLPDGTIKNLVWVREYDPNRQMAYVFRQAVFLPRGSRVIIVGYFDNSESNPRVDLGAKEANDMLGAFLEYLDS